MTTHDEQTKTAANSNAHEAPTPPPGSSEGMEPSAARVDPSADAPPTQGEPRTTGDAPRTTGDAPRTTGDASVAAGDEASTARRDPSHMENEPSSGPPTSPSLFADTDVSGLRSRWDNVQAAFVDNPEECVQKADTLVAEVVDQLTTGFSDARSRLEAQWARGEKVSTEDLRIALKRYRDFFQRLLSV
jgi:hypothetical protein